MYTIVLLTETALTEHDVTRVAQLHGEEPVEVHLLVPADADHNRFIEALDDVALGWLPDDDGPATPEQADDDARHAVSDSVAALTAAGMQARGSVTGPDPVGAAVEAARLDDADEVIVVTPPHLVQSGLHRDWASRLRDDLELPVLHVISGTDRIVG